ncbi:hypothetical protein [Flavobacterium sp. HNIBRBA15423]|uniref:hypothetical protein n=1 Tax=Flavobacterium sp. HNIBRBA15423 TaxID=3458683 RepID=UPI004043FE90
MEKKLKTILEVESLKKLTQVNYKILILFILLTSCNDSKLDNEYNKFLNEYNLNATISDKFISNKTIEIDVVFEGDNKIVDENHQKLFCILLINELNLLSKFDIINFNCSYININKESVINKFNYDENLYIYLKDERLLNIYKYCLKNFNKYDFSKLDGAIQNARSIFDNSVLDTSFFESIKLFSDECVKGNENTKARLTYIVIYSNYKNASDPFMKNISKHIKNIWDFGGMKDIENAESVLFESLEEK